MRITLNSDFCSSLPKVFRRKPGGTRASSDFQTFSEHEIQLIFDLLQKSKLRYKKEWIIAGHTAINTGLRYKDIAVLQWNNIRDNEYIELVPYETEYKTGKAVMIPISANLAPILTKSRKRIFICSPDSQKVIQKNRLDNL